MSEDIKFNTQNGVLVVYKGKKLFGNIEVKTIPELTPEKIRLVGLIYKDIQQLKNENSVLKAFLETEINKNISKFFDLP